MIGVGPKLKELSAVISPTVFSEGRILKASIYIGVHAFDIVNVHFVPGNQQSVFEDQVKRIRAGTAWNDHLSVLGDEQHQVSGVGVPPVLCHDDLDPLARALLKVTDSWPHVRREGAVLLLPKQAANADLSGLPYLIQSEDGHEIKLLLHDWLEVNHWRGSMWHYDLLHQATEDA